MEIVFVTSNQEKINIANAALAGSGVIIKTVNINCPEIQDDDNKTIALYSAEYASNHLKNNVIKVDTGLYIETLNGFPGPYSSYVEKRLSAVDILKLMDGKLNRAAYYKEVLAYCEYGNTPIAFETYTRGEISKTISGSYGFEYDKIFILNGDKFTMANFNEDERASRYSHENWINLKNYILESS